MRGRMGQTARQRVLERFGDPAAVARRLWLDAMKGKIMTQRILVACCVLLTLISLSLAGMMWMQAVALPAAGRCEPKPGRQPRCDALRTSRSRCSSSEGDLEGGANLPRRRTGFPSRSSSPRRRTTVRRPSGSRPAGSGNQGASKEEAIQRESDDKGHGRFRRRPARRLGVHAEPEAGDGGQWYATGKLNVLPGTTIEKTIVCPRIDEQRVPVSVRFDWPGRPAPSRPGRDRFASAPGTHLPAPAPLVTELLQQFMIIHPGDLISSAARDRTT